MLFVSSYYVQKVAGNRSLLRIDVYGYFSSVYLLRLGDKTITHRVTFS